MPGPAILFAAERLRGFAGTASPSSLKAIAASGARGDESARARRLQCEATIERFEGSTPAALVSHAWTLLRKAEIALISSAPR